MKLAAIFIAIASAGTVAAEYDAKYGSDQYGNTNYGSDNYGSNNYGSAPYAAPTYPTQKPIPTSGVFVPYLPELEINGGYEFDQSALTFNGESGWLTDTQYEQFANLQKNYTYEECTKSASVSQNGLPYSPINFEFTLPQSCSTPKNFFNYLSKKVPCGCATASITENQAITIDFLEEDADKNVCNNGYIQVAIPCQKPVPTTVKSYYNDYDDYDYGHDDYNSHYLFMKEEATYKKPTGSYKKPTDSYKKPSYKKPTDSYKPQPTYGSYVHQPQAIRCYLKSLTLHTVSEHTVQGNHFAAEASFRLTNCSENSIYPEIVLHQTYNALYVPPIQPKSYRKGYYSPYTQGDYYGSSNYNGYLKKLITMIQEEAKSYKATDDDDYSYDDDYYYGDDDKETSFPGDIAAEYDDTETNLLTKTALKDARLGNDYNTWSNDKKSMEAGHTWLKIVNFVARELINVTTSGYGYEESFTFTPIYGSKVLDFDLNVASLISSTNGAIVYVGTDTDHCFNDTLVLVTGDTLIIPSHVVETNEYVNELTISDLNAQLPFADDHTRAVLGNYNRKFTPETRGTVYLLCADTCTAVPPPAQCKPSGPTTAPPGPAPDNKCVTLEPCDLSRASIGQCGAGEKSWACDNGKTYACSSASGTWAWAPWQSAESQNTCCSGISRETGKCTIHVW